MKRRPSVLALFVLLVLLAAACGQKAGVSGSAEGVAAGASASGGDADLGVGGGGGGSGDVATSDTVAGSAPSSGAGAASTGGGSAGVAGGSGAAGGSAGAPAPATGGDRTGVTDTEIKIGLHAPVTGAAPVPTESFRRGLEIYWRSLDNKGGVFGRKVRVVFRDDEFNPSTAVRVCREMVEQEKVFLLIGAAGADQITACAKYASSVGVPYFSAGVNESGLTGLRGYFALSQTYLQQVPALAQLAKKTSQSGKFAVLVEDTPSFRESKAAIESAAKQAGLNVVYSEFVSKGASQAEILTTSSQLRGSGADVVFFLGPPTTFISLAQQGQGQGYVPSYIGPGLSNGLNIVATAGCPGIANSQFLSPFPQTDAIDKMDPEFSRQYRAQTGQEPDDFGVALWGLNKTIDQFFRAAGKDMTRQSLVATLESGKQFATGVYPPLQYNARNHFGAQSSHLLKADCGARVFKTAATFVKGF